MSTYFGVLFHQYWDGHTGRQIAALGGPIALLLGAYVIGNRNDNMIGLYRLPFADIKLPISHEELAGAFAVLEATDYAAYDYGTEIVWVREMARYRLGLAPDDQLKREDRRLSFVHSLYDRAPDNPFLAPFYRRYVKTLHLPRARSSKLARIASPWQAPSEALTSPLEAPSNVPKRNTKSKRNKESTKYSTKERRSDQDQIRSGIRSGDQIRSGSDQKITAPRNSHERLAKLDANDPAQRELLRTIDHLRRRTPIAHHAGRGHR